MTTYTAWYMTIAAIIHGQVIWFYDPDSDEFLG